MKNKLLFLLLCLSIQSLAQQIGDTIVVKGFKYSSTSRDTVIPFPNINLPFAKIIMKYNMRCKNALVSTSNQRNLGCGEWDYSCNTFIVDSSRIESAQNTHPNYIISSFSGTNFNYVTQPTYDYYNFLQTNVTHSITTESQFPVGTGVTSVTNLLNANQKSGRTQVLYTAAELVAAGYTAGAINGILLNVSNVGGAANFFRVNVKHTTLTALTSASVSTTGFTTVYNQNYSFVNGSNRIQFYTPFAWDGVSNLIFDYSFTNSTPSTPIVFNGINTSTTQAVYTTNNYALDLSSDGHAIINSALMSNINNEISISFWAFGTSNLMPSNTSILYATPTNTTQRSLNIHLPWSDNNVYFDCGNTGGSFDRVQKVSTAANQGGRWNHWTFTKNATFGDMKIYLNGNLWLMAVGKAKAISIINLILGKTIDMQNNYKGKVNELCIWNKELGLTDIQNWMNKPIDNTHPFYSNLLAYYKMDEGTGNIISDTKNNLSSTCTNVFWTYDRGHTLNRMFTETTQRPSIVLLRGTYALTTNTVIVKDSIQRIPNTVRQYSVVSNASVTPMLSDAVVLVGTSTLYQAVSNIYNGDNGALTGTLAITPSSVITVSNMNYINRFPYYTELISFVTPYGIGLDFGPKGKTWFYDVSDFAPLLKGKKRLVMAMGGEYQEEMDIDFWFIVGTPPRTVLSFNQLWQGAYRWGGVGINSIVNDSYFTNLNVPLNPNGQSFKVRSSITGHGSEGEFGQNGGNITHYLNVNGGANEFSWQVTQRCAFNPVFPQGGTWVYDRQGWCPGEASLLKENYITPFVTAGSSVNLDYNCSPAQVPTGDYRYIASHQLVTYGGANYTLDANIVDVILPSNKVLYSRINPMCANPVVLVQNTGSTPITTLQVEYWLNTATTKQTYTWTGNLAFMDTTSIRLPIANLWKNGLSTTDNVFNVELKKANNVTDNYSYNNKYQSALTLADVITGSLTVEFKTNNFPSENTYKIVDDNGNTIAGASALTTANTTYTDTYVLNGCYKLIVTDNGEDGLQWWASSGQGVGFIRFKDELGNIIKTFQPDFGGGFEYNFSTASIQSLNENEWNSRISIYPNPAHHLFYISGTDFTNAKMSMIDMLGKEVNAPVKIEKDKIEVDTKALSTGVYTVKILADGINIVKKVTVY